MYAISTAQKTRVLQGGGQKKERPGNFVYLGTFIQQQKRSHCVNLTSFLETIFRGAYFYLSFNLKDLQNVGYQLVDLLGKQIEIREFPDVLAQRIVIDSFLEVV